MRTARSEVERAADLLSQLPDGMAAETKAQEILDIQDTSASLLSGGESPPRRFLRVLGNVVARIALGRRFRFLQELERKYYAERAAAAREKDKEEKRKVAM